MTNSPIGGTTATPDAAPFESADAHGLSAMARPAEGHSSPDRELTDEHRDFAAFHQGYVWNAITLADTKASWAFAICAGMVAYLVGKEETRTILLQMPWTPMSALAAATLLLLIAGAAFAFLVIVPRLNASSEGLVYFGAVARHADAATYVCAVAGSSLRDLIRARVVHAFDISRIASRKYDLLRRSMWCAVAGLALAALLTALGWRTPEQTEKPPVHADAPSAAEVLPRRDRRPTPPAPPASSLLDAGPTQAPAATSRP